jgi:hypothetical protein
MTVLLLYYYFLCPSVAALNPIIWLTETEHDFGDIPREQPATFQFVFRNISADTLSIDNVRTECGCTTPDWSERRIAPQDTAHIAITYDAIKMGSFEKSISVWIHGYRKGTYLTISGQVLE